MALLFGSIDVCGGKRINETFANFADSLIEL